MKDDMAKKILEKYHGKVFIEVEKIAKSIENIGNMMDEIRKNAMSGKVYKVDFCKGGCACTGACYPSDFKNMENAIYKAIDDLDLYKHMRQ